eukprot:c12341_g1_i1 orf=198-626(-)
MDDTQKQNVRTLHTAYAIWTQLQETYQHRTVGNQVNNLKILMDTRMSDGHDPEKFLTQWRLKLDNLLLSGLDLPSRVQAIILLAAQPPSWQSLTTTQANSPTLAIPSLVPLITQEAALRTVSGSAQVTPSTTLAMYAGSNQR